jgi:hypothetical protein
VQYFDFIYKRECSKTYTTRDNGSPYLPAAEWLDVSNTLLANIEDRHISAGRVREQ